LKAFIFGILPPNRRSEKKDSGCRKKAASQNKAAADPVIPIELAPLG
jgi:hypothetical protein